MKWRTSLIVLVVLVLSALAPIAVSADGPTPNWAYPAAHWLGTAPDQISGGFDAWIKVCTADCAFLRTPADWNKAYYNLVNKFLEERGSPDAFLINANGDAQGLTPAYQYFVYPYVFLVTHTVPRGVQP